MNSRLLFILLVSLNMIASAQEFQYDKETRNSEGLLEGIHIKEGKYEHLYRKGLLNETVDHRVSVMGLSSLKGSYKNSKPYEGYFVLPKNELNLVDYYENGIQVAQYSKPPLSPDRDWHDASFKSIYKDGKIWNGVKYQTGALDDGAFLIASEHYKDGKKMKANLLLGAMHYAEVFELKFKPDGYILQNANKTDQTPDLSMLIVTFRKDNTGRVRLISNDGISFQYDFRQEPISKPKLAQRGVVKYFKNTEGYFYRQSFNSFVDPDLFGANHSVLDRIIWNIDMNSALEISENAENNYLDIFREGINSILLNMAILNDNGTTRHGYDIKPSKISGKYDLSKYENNKLSFVKEGISAKKLETLAKFRENDFTYTVKEGEKEPEEFKPFTLKKITDDEVKATGTKSETSLKDTKAKTRNIPSIIKQTSQKEFNTSLVKTKWIPQGESEGSVTITTDFSADSLETETNIFSSYGRVLRIVPEYTQRKLTKMRYYDNQGELSSYIEVTSYHNNQVKSQTTFDAKGKILNKTNNDFNALDQLIKTTYLDSAGEIEREFLNEFNKDKWLVKTTHRPKNEKAIITTHLYVEFDDQKNWTKSVVTDSNGKNVLIQRTIEYYD